MGSQVLKVVLEIENNIILQRFSEFLTIRLVQVFIGPKVSDILQFFLRFFDSLF